MALQAANVGVGDAQPCRLDTWSYGLQSVEHRFCHFAVEGVVRLDEDGVRAQRFRLPERQATPDSGGLRRGVENSVTIVDHERLLHLSWVSTPLDGNGIAGDEDTGDTHRQASLAGVKSG